MAGWLHVAMKAHVSEDLILVAYRMGFGVLDFG